MTSTVCRGGAYLASASGGILRKLAVTYLLASVISMQLIAHSTLIKCARARSSAMQILWPLSSGALKYSRECESATPIKCIAHEDANQDVCPFESHSQSVASCCATEVVNHQGALATIKTLLARTLPHLKENRISGAREHLIDCIELRVKVSQVRATRFTYSGNGENLKTCEFKFKVFCSRSAANFFPFF